MTESSLSVDDLNIFILASPMSDDTDKAPPLAKVPGQDGPSADNQSNRPKAEGETAQKENPRKRPIATMDVDASGLDGRSDKSHTVIKVKSELPNFDREVGHPLSEPSGAPSRIFTDSCDPPLLVEPSIDHTPICPNPSPYLITRREAVMVDPLPRTLFQAELDYIQNDPVGVSGYPERPEYKQNQIGMFATPEIARAWSYGTRRMPVTGADDSAYTNAILSNEALTLEGKSLPPGVASISCEFRDQSGPSLGVALHRNIPLFPIFEDITDYAKAKEIFETVDTLPLSRHKPITKYLPGDIDMDDPRSNPGFRIPDSVIQDYPFVSYMDMETPSVPVMTAYIQMIQEQFPHAYVLAMDHVALRHHSRLMASHAIFVSQWFKSYDSALTRSYYVHKWYAGTISGYRKVAVLERIRKMTEQYIYIVRIISRSLGRNIVSQTPTVMAIGCFDDNRKYNLDKEIVSPFLRSRFMKVDTPLCQIPAWLETLDPLNHMQKVMQCLSWFPDIIEETLINVYWEALPAILSNLYPNIPFTAMLPLEYTRLEYHEGLYPLSKAMRYERLMIMLMNLESRIPNVNEAQMADLVYDAQTVEVRTVWRYVCGNVNDDQPVRAVLRAFIQICRSTRRLRQYDSYKDNLHDGYHPYFCPDEPTPLDEAIVASFLPHERMDCVLQDPPTPLDQLIVASSLWPHSSVKEKFSDTHSLNIDGNPCNFNSMGHKIHGRPINMDMEVYKTIRKHPLVLGEATQAYGAQLQITRLWNRLKGQPVPAGRIMGITACGQLCGFSSLFSLIAGHRKWSGIPELELWKYSQLPIITVIPTLTFYSSTDVQLGVRQTDPPTGTRMAQLKRIMKTRVTQPKPGMKQLLHNWVYPYTVPQSECSPEHLRSIAAPSPVGFDERSLSSDNVSASDEGDSPRGRGRQMGRRLYQQISVQSSTQENPESHAPRPKQPGASATNTTVTISTFGPMKSWSGRKKSSSIAQAKEPSNKEKTMAEAIPVRVTSRLPQSSSHTFATTAPSGGVSETKASSQMFTSKTQFNDAGILGQPVIPSSNYGPTGASSTGQVGYVPRAIHRSVSRKDGTKGSIHGHWSRSSPEEQGYYLRSSSTLPPSGCGMQSSAVGLPWRNIKKDWSQKRSAARRCHIRPSKEIKLTEREEGRLDRPSQRIGRGAMAILQRLDAGTFTDQEMAAYKEGQWKLFAQVATRATALLRTKVMAEWDTLLLGHTYPHDYQVPKTFWGLNPDELEKKELRTLRFEISSHYYERRAQYLNAQFEKEAAAESSLPTQEPTREILAGSSTPLDFQQMTEDELIAFFMNYRSEDGSSQSRGMSLSTTNIVADQNNCAKEDSTEEPDIVKP